MKRIALLVLLGLGSVSGFAYGFHAIRHHHFDREGGCHGFDSSFRERRVQELAEACVRAARETPPPNTAPTH